MYPNLVETLSRPVTLNHTLDQVKFIETVIWSKR